MTDEQFQQILQRLDRLIELHQPTVLEPLHVEVSPVPTDIPSWLCSLIANRVLEIRRENSGATDAT